jgi:hypothetical protein
MAAICCSGSVVTSTRKNAALTPGAAAVEGSGCAIAQISAPPGFEHYEGSRLHLAPDEIDYRVHQWQTFLEPTGAAVEHRAGADAADIAEVLAACGGMGSSILVTRNVTLTPQHLERRSGRVETIIDVHHEQTGCTARQGGVESSLAAFRDAVTDRG